MASIKDDRGYNQGFEPSYALDIRTLRRCDNIIARMKIKTGIEILEIGCGTGKMSYLLAERTGEKVTGIDICDIFIEESKAKYLLPNLSYKVLDLTGQKYSDKETGQGKFDYIVGNGILHHVFRDISALLRTLRSMLKENGKIIFFEPNLFNPYCFFIFKFPAFRKIARLDPEEMAFSRRFIVEKLSGAGFADIDVSYKDFLLPCTPKVLVNPLIMTGSILEKMPFLKLLAQSLFITASKEPAKEQTRFKSVTEKSLT